MTDVLGVLPARGGSKRVPRKNVRTVGEKPLIAHTIEQAEAAERIDEAIVSTEDEEIKEVAREWGGRVPFDRPDHLATDTATNNDVVEHAIEWCEREWRSFDVVCLLSVTTPFRSPKDIDAAIGTLERRDATSVVSTTEFDDPPHWALETDEDGYLQPFFDTDAMWSVTRTQEVPTLSHPNSSIYVAPTDVFVERKSFYTDRTVAYEMPRARSIDIDEPFDLRVARALMSER